jgi:glucokinase
VGHIGFAPLDELEDQLLVIFRQRFGRVVRGTDRFRTWLANLYRAMAAIEGREAASLGDETTWNGRSGRIRSLGRAGP